MPDRLTSVLADLSPEKVWDWFNGAPLKIVITLVVAFALRFVLQRLIGRMVKVTLARADARRAQEPGRARRRQGRRRPRPLPPRPAIRPRPAATAIPA